MPREANKLSAPKVSKLKTPGRYCDGLGLWLQVSQAGTKAWLFRYMRHGRARQMGLAALQLCGGTKSGGLPIFSLRIPQMSAKGCEN